MNRVPCPICNENIVAEPIVRSKQRDGWAAYGSAWCEGCKLPLYRRWGNKVVKGDSGWLLIFKKDVDIVETVELDEIELWKKKIKRYPSTFKNLEILLGRKQDGDVYYKCRTGGDKYGLAIIRNEYSVGTFSCTISL